MRIVFIVEDAPITEKGMIVECMLSNVCAEKVFYNTLDEAKEAFKEKYRHTGYVITGTIGFVYAECGSQLD